MIKKLADLNKEEKISLLKLIADQEIDREIITPDTLFATEYGDYFSGLQIICNQIDENDQPIVICLGEARTARDYAEKIEGIEVVTDEGTILETILIKKNNYK
jgi:hypothetical protein